MFRRFTPGRFIPENAKAIEHSGGVVYTYSANSALYAVAYQGNRSKADWHYLFRTEERRNEEIQSFIKSLDASDRYKAERKMQRSQPHTIKAGEIVYNSWGYEQTNVDFLQSREGHSSLYLGSTDCGRNNRNRIHARAEKCFCRYPLWRNNQAPCCRI